MLVRLALFSITMALFFGFDQKDSPPVKRALIIAVGDYDMSRTGWSPIHSMNDARLLDAALKKQDFEVDVVANPTRAQIETAFETLRLKAQPGDVVFVHISSHGVQITDDNGDEADGFDESIVPIDAPDESKMPTGYKGENHLRDDRLGELLTGIRTRLGAKGDLLVLLDACHSGTGTRGPGGVVRGSREPLRLAGLPAKPADGADPGGFFELPKSPALSDITIVSAAQASHLNYENAAQHCGSLTSAFCSILKEVGTMMSYQAFFERVQTKIALINVCDLTGQRPELESTRPARILFGGPVVDSKPNFPILALNADRQTAVINGGKLRGIDVGARLKLYRAGDNPTTAKALDSAVVESASEVESRLKFAGQLPIKKPAEGVFYLARRIFRDDTLFVNIDTLPLAMQKTMQQLHTRTAYPVAIRNAGFDVSTKLVERADGNGIRFHLPGTGQAFPKVSADPDELLYVLETLYWRKTLQRTTLRQEDITVNWTIEHRAAPGRDTTTYLQTRQGKLYARQAKSGYYLRVQNGSNVPIWFNILDFQPDGIFSVYWPRIDTQEEGYRLQPGETKNLSFELGPPFGAEVFKLFAATSALDMRSFVQGQSRGPAANDTPLTRFFKNRLSTRGATYPVDPKEGKTMEIQYVIVP